MNEIERLTDSLNDQGLLFLELLSQLISMEYDFHLRYL